MKFRGEVGAFSTRFIIRHITVHANSKEEAIEKMKDKYDELEKKMESVDTGTITIDENDVEQID